MVMGARKKELGAWQENGREDRKCKCSQNAVKSVSIRMSRGICRPVGGGGGGVHLNPFLASKIFDTHRKCILVFYHLKVVH